MQAAMDSETAIKLCFEKSGVQRSCIVSARWSEGSGTMRLPEALLKIFPDEFTTITGSKNACRRGEILVDGRKGRTSDTVQEGQLLTRVLKSGGPTFSTMPLDPNRLGNTDAGSCPADPCLVSPEATCSLGLGSSFEGGEVGNPNSEADLDLALEVVYEDEHMGVVIKPQGLPTQGKGTRTAQGLLLARARPTARQQKPRPPGGGPPCASVSDSIPLDASPSDPFGSDNHRKNEPRDSHSDGNNNPPSAGAPLAPGANNHANGGVRRGLRLSSLPGRMTKPAAAHRLDAPTGGLLLCGKTRAALAALCGFLRQRRVTKRYSALVKGRLNGSGFVSLPLRGQPSVSRFEAVETYDSVAYGALTLVRLWPLTGRYHQLRKHCAFLGHPILGDQRYRVAHGSWVREAAAAPDGFVTRYKILVTTTSDTAAQERATRREDDTPSPPNFVTSKRVKVDHNGVASVASIEAECPESVTASVKPSDESAVEEDGPSRNAAGRFEFIGTNPKETDPMVVASEESTDSNLLSLCLGSSRNAFREEIDGRRILLFRDEAAVREFGRRFLARLGVVEGEDEDAGGAEVGGGSSCSDERIRGATGHGEEEKVAVVVRTSDHDNSNDCAEVLSLAEGEIQEETGEEDGGLRVTSKSDPGSAAGVPALLNGKGKGGDLATGKGLSPCESSEEGRGSGEAPERGGGGEEVGGQEKEEEMNEGVTLDEVGGEQARLASGTRGSAADARASGEKSLSMAAATPKGLQHQEEEEEEKEQQQHLLLEQAEGQSLQHSKIQQQGVDFLADGSESPLCLWAVDLELEHPVDPNIKPLHFDIQKHADRVYHRILRIEGGIK